MAESPEAKAAEEIDEKNYIYDDDAHLCDVDEMQRIIAKANAAHFLPLLRDVKEELEIEIDGTGPCDHSVGICICKLIGRWEAVKAEIARLEAAKEERT